MFFSKQSTTKILQEVSDDNVRVLEIYKNKVGTFKLFCDVKKADGTIGNNNNFSISMLTDNGFVIVADNNDIGIPKVRLSDSTEEALNKITDAFEIFKSFADKL